VCGGGGGGGGVDGDYVLGGKAESDRYEPKKNVFRINDQQILIHKEKLSVAQTEHLFVVEARIELSTFRPVVQRFYQLKISSFNKRRAESADVSWRGDFSGGLCW
jgi:hypothetical protein